MSYKLVFLPPVNDRHHAWADGILAEVSDIDILFAQSRDQALVELADARAAFGTLDAELLAAAPALEWLAAPAAGPRPEFYFPELVASDVIVTNQRGIYNDHISAHIMAFVLAFAQGLADEEARERVLHAESDREMWGALGDAIRSQTITRVAPA